MTKNTTALDVVSVIAELAQIRAEKADLAKRESAIRAEVLDYVGKTASLVANPLTGEVIAEVVESERRSVSDWDSFATDFPEAYEALVKFTNVLTLNLK